MKQYLNFRSPVGNLLLGEEDEKLILLGFNKDEHLLDEPGTPFLHAVVTQLEEYFAGTRKKFQLPLKLEGTDFQQQVWQALQAIPYGETRTYKEISEQIKRPKAYRAVGLANNRNPIAIIIPCHRVIGTNGKLVGFGGGLDTKAFLLDLERK